LISWEKGKDFHTVEFFQNRQNISSLDIFQCATHIQLKEKRKNMLSIKM
jgi:hypothetical protein